MRPRSAAVIALRVFAIVLAVQVVTAVISFLIISRGFEGSGSFWAFVGTTAVIAWFLWIAAVNLANAMVRGTPDEAAASPRPTVNTHAVALSIVGVILVAEAIPALMSVAASDVGGASFGPLSFPISDFGSFDRGAAVASQITRIVVGVFLMLGSGEIARGLARRYPEPEAPPSTPPETP